MDQITKLLGEVIRPLSPEKMESAFDVEDIRNKQESRSTVIKKDSKMACIMKESLPAGNSLKLSRSGRNETM